MVLTKKSPLLYFIKQKLEILGFYFVYTSYDLPVIFFTTADFECDRFVLRVEVLSFDV